MSNNRNRLNRRSLLATSAVALAATRTGRSADDGKKTEQDAREGLTANQLCPHPFLTPADDFYNVSRGNPKPYTLEGEALEKARLTEDTWRLEITADPFTEDGVVKEPASAQQEFKLEDNSSITLDHLMELGKKHSVKFIKAMQCLNVPAPLGQGLWEGVPLSVVLRECGKLSNVRRIYFWGFHNNDPKQIFQSSVSYTQAMETPPGDLPVFLAYRLNGAPLPLERGGPVRMVIPWAHGFKSIKWLHHIFLTNDYRINDTYALNNNDPESYLKTAAYLDDGPKEYKFGEPVILTGQAISGRSGLQRVEYWVRRLEEGARRIEDDSEELLAAPWKPCEIVPAPDWSTVLPPGVLPKDVLGFDSETGEPSSWPLRYGMVSYNAVLRDLPPGRYELRARTVDKNGFAQPEPRSIQKSGRNAIQMRRITVTD